MNVHEIEGKWKQLKGEAKVHWGRLTGDELDEVDGNRDRLVGLIQERYGKARAEAEQEVDAWFARL